MNNKPQPHEANLVLGTICHSSKTEELLPAFHDELTRIMNINGTDTFEHLLPESGELKRRIETGNLTSEDECKEMIRRLMNELDDLAPAHCYFGAHPLRRDDFGFWSNTENENTHSVIVHFPHKSLRVPGSLWESHKLLKRLQSIGNACGLELVSHRVSNPTVEACTVEELSRNLPPLAERPKFILHS